MGHIGPSDAFILYALAHNSARLADLGSDLDQAIAVLQSGPAIGTVRPQRQFFQQQGNIGIRNCEGGRINRDQRRLSEPTPEPSAQLQLVEPHRCRNERLEEPLALRGSRAQPSIVAWTRGKRRISREPLNEFQHTQLEKRKFHIFNMWGAAIPPFISLWGRTPKQWQAEPDRAYD
ncbi:hypothetical protein [Bradyrhizobium sp. RT9a]|uniref:hypothetical protein n=1 Tax=Bradyrhizobium sp. RT9a TaxID=3156384 RepID=UPI00339A238C